MKTTSMPVNSDARDVALSATVVLATIFAVTSLFAGSATAQTTVNQPTTTTLWAGSQDITQFGLGGFTTPTSGVILSGTATSAITGQPVRHLWFGDAINGLGRIDPEVDQVIPATAGIGGRATGTWKYRQNIANNSSTVFIGSQ